MKGASLPLGTLDVDRAAHEIDVALDDRQPQAGVQTVLAAARRVGAVEALEDVLPSLPA